ncbi:predicted protein [Histoplasma capsulatum var. duboisii H88]|uniref:Predicted protein n=1 Tax=Ajellomyces capsulatus (strain H88) TaxID=544711 RepID=F0UH46_AJEC8|nr:predicted protein [Histoplasma capsulatum var. duboisii H88]
MRFAVEKVDCLKGQDNPSNSHDQESYWPLPHARATYPSRWLYHPPPLTAGNGHRDAMQTLLRNRANIDFTDVDGDTPLIKAASKGHDNVTRTLLCKGANPNFCNEWSAIALLTTAAF